jgi:hypothetical protein
MVERIVLLRTIDSLWVEHLTELDDMRRGIGLRGYSGTDPLNEFKREAFALYDELRGFIRGQVASTIFPRPGPTSRRADADAAAGPPVSRPRPTPRRRSGPRPRSGGGHEQWLGRRRRSRARRPTPAPPPRPAPPQPQLLVPHRLLPGLGGGTPRMMREQLGDDVRQPAGASNVPGQKLGRNDPCYCGSGLKYKKCHGPLTPPRATIVPQTPEFVALFFEIPGSTPWRRRPPPYTRRNTPEVALPVFDTPSRTRVTNAASRAREERGSLEIGCHRRRARRPDRL